MSSQATAPWHTRGGKNARTMGEIRLVVMYNVASGTNVAYG
jgi:hypothetical protein